jgi:hypothetical protein
MYIVIEHWVTLIMIAHCFTYFIFIYSILAYVAAAVQYTAFSIHILKCKSIYNIFDMRFSGFFCCYSVTHCSNKPTIKIIDGSFL